MCGRFNVIDSPEVKDLCDNLGVPLDTISTQLDIAPGGKINIIHGGASARKISEATWWLLLENRNLNQTIDTRVLIQDPPSCLSKIQYHISLLGNRAVSFHVQLS